MKQWAITYCMKPHIQYRWQTAIVEAASGDDAVKLVQHRLGEDILARGGHSNWTVRCVGEHVVPTIEGRIITMEAQ